MFYKFLLNESQFARLNEFAAEFPNIKSAILIRHDIQMLGIVIKPRIIQYIN